MKIKKIYALMLANGYQNKHLNLFILKKVTLTMMTIGVFSCFFSFCFLHTINYFDISKIIFWNIQTIYFTKNRQVFLFCICFLSLLLWCARYFVKSFYVYKNEKIKMYECLRRNSMLEIKHLTKAYERVILKDVCLSFKEKGLYVITGKSGCGKSTLLNMIGGLDSNYQGIIEMDGRDIQTIPRYIQKYVGFIFQQFHLIEEMNVKENETLISYFKRIFSAKKEILLSRLKLKKLQSYKTKLLSGGQKQRIAIYRGFIANHPVVLCDEPTGALDVKNSEEVFKTLKELAKEKLVIVISHDEKLASKYHDYLYEIKNQQIHLVHQNKIKETITAKEKTTKKSFFQFLLKDFKLCWKSHFIVIQVLFIALLSIMLTLSLTNSTNKQIQAQLEKIIPSTTIMLKKKNNEMLTQKDLQNIHHKEITYRFLQNDDVEFLGISPLKKYQTNKTLYISDYIQKPKYKIQGKEIGNDQEIILARSTYEQLIYLTKQKSLMNQEVYLFFDYQNEVKSYPVKIVGIEEKETVMETLYLKEFAFNHYLQELYQLEQGHTAFLQVKK